MTFTIPESGVIPIDYFKDLLDISKIVYYDLEEKNGVLKLRFYDSKKKLINLYKETKNGNEKQKSKKAKSKNKQAKD
jgi:hypothetical protein